MKRTYRKLTAGEVKAIQDYAAEKGRNWKDALRDDWYYARRPGYLQSIRNEFGPTWLMKLKLKDLDNEERAEFSKASLFARNDIQFPRLLAEIRAVGLTPEQYRDLQVSMDLSRDDIDELLYRAEGAFEAEKNKIGR